MIYEYIVTLLEGVDLERFSALPVILTAFVIILCIAYVFRGLFSLFNQFWK